MDSLEYTLWGSEKQIVVTDSNEMVCVSHTNIVMIIN